MEQINTYAFFNLSKWLEGIFLQLGNPSVPPVVISPFVNASRTILDGLLTGSGKYKLNESAGAGATLLATLDAIAARLQAGQSAADMVTQFNIGFFAFDTALALELGRAPTFFVTQKGIYSTPSLINTAELAYAEDVRQIISSEALRDVNQAGRCLAFELGTAAAYHALRATEKVLREYYSLLVKKATDDLRMKQAIDELVKAGADVKTMAVVNQVRDLHRNPVDHPDVFLDVTEAMEVFDICKSAISAMARQIKSKQPPLPGTTTP